MKWSGRQGSGNVEDRRGMGGRVAIGGGIGGLVILLLSLFFGNGDISPQDVNIGNGASDPNYQPTEEENQNAQFVSVVLKDTEDVWHQLLQEQGSEYVEPHLVLFSGSTDSGCGYAQAA